jgi:hypothetical protein
MERLPQYDPLILHALSVGDSLLVIALVHKNATAWLTSARVLRNDEITDADLNAVLSELQNEIAREMNSQDLATGEAVAP